MAKKAAHIRDSFLVLTGVLLGYLGGRLQRGSSSHTDTQDSLGAGGRSTVEALRVAEEWRKRGSKLSK